MADSNHRTRRTIAITIFSLFMVQLMLFFSIFAL